MNSTELRQGCTYSFEIIKEASTKKAYKVRTDDGIEFSLLKFKFQQDEPTPDRIDCYVKSLYPLQLGQDIAVHIKNFYEEGKVYNFTIKGIKKDPEIQYELEDDHGLYFKLFNAPSTLSKGSRVKCRIIKIRDVNVTLKYEGTLSMRFPLEFYTIDQWANILKISEETYHFKYFLTEFEEFKDAHAKYEAKDPTWILDVLQVCSQHITDWLIECKENLNSLKKICDRINIIRDLALYIIEESDFLRKCNPEQRSNLQNRLSNYIDLFEQYITATTSIINKVHEEYIDKMLRHLKEAGYLYKPSRQIRIMMTIFKLRPGLINSRMAELFDALHNWDVENWQSEPFRAALVEQLQIFIEENSPSINSLPVSDSSGYNKSVGKMILAIAVQRLLATDKDHFDADLNRAMLYRYISYLIPNDVDALLEKAIKSLLGIENPNEFTWADTETPNFLFNKAAFPFPAIEDNLDVAKTYNTSKAYVKLQGGKLMIVAHGADPDETVIPNNMFEWLVPSISLKDQINLPGSKKSKDLKTFQKFWNEMAWSIFGVDEKAGEKIEKRVPETGEEVKVIIDDVRILDSGNEKQRLQFHCTILDELYYGEGWMPCDAKHFIGWLSYKDVPGNYDMNLSFARNDMGDPLIFHARVYRKEDGSLEFNMKSQLENYLLETMYPGLEQVAIVTKLDKLNNAWICLGEFGSTFKVGIDESNQDLNEGMLVKVRYIEPDRSSLVSQFFIGEISTDREDVPAVIKKSQCLYNLMQGLGEEAESYDGFEVMEVEEVMTKEELTELIYILQRRAYSETEYIRAFNYLGLATILCRLAEEPSLLSEITIHMDLLILFYEFGKNRSLNFSQIEEYEEKVERIPMLERLYARLKIVSHLDDHTDTEWLWEIKNNPRNETEGSLAALVLSYNLLPKSLEAPRKDIMKQITTLLNVNNVVSTSKYYGEESQTMEFKSSLIYSTHGGGKPTPKEQLHEITHIICGFMNARGGDLYIGVNDSGYENGLDDDINYRKLHGERATIDAMIVDLQNHLDRTLPSFAKDHWEISSDPESKKGVIKVKVLPVEQPVELDGVIYVRSSSTTKPRLDEQREEFIKNRSQNYKLLLAMWGLGDKISENDENNADTNESSEATQDSLSGASATSQIDNEETLNTETNSGIATGKHRLNVLHYYNPNFAEPSFYLYFINDDTFYMSPEDKFIEEDDDCRLALAIREKELDGYLIFTNEDGKIGKITINEVAELNPNQPQLLSDSSLTMVNVAKKEDYVLSVLRINSGSLFYRIDSVENLADLTSFDQAGERILESDYEILNQEIVSESRLSLFDSDSINREPKFFGVSVPIGDGTWSDEERINRLLAPVAHSE